MAACVFDSTLMLLLTDSLAVAPLPPEGIVDVAKRGADDLARDRLNFLLETLDNARTDVVVPAPVLTELLASAKTDVAATLGVIEGLARVRVEGFGQRAAIECADMLRDTGRGIGSRTKIKFDHQIVAIAKVVRAIAVYSDDNDVKALCRRESLECQGVWDLPARPADAQRKLDL